MDAGRKLPENLENPVDNFILKYIVDPLNPYFKSIGMTPNGLTAISGIFGIISIFCIFKSNYLLAALFFAISYIFDVFDGNFARKYNMVTKFGDWFDHMKDNLIIFGIIFVLFKKKDINFKNKIVALSLYIILAILSFKYLTLQETYYHSNFSVPEEEKSKTLELLKSFFGSSGNDSYLNKNLNTFKWFGPGTLNTYMVLVLVYFHIKKNKS